jgi:hypothetical protein
MAIVDCDNPIDNRQKRVIAPFTPKVGGGTAVQVGGTRSGRTHR